MKGGGTKGGGCSRGFTLVEVLVAVLIMAVGFLAMAEMEFLSLEQHRFSSYGTLGANMIQHVSDFDIESVRRIHMLNSTAYVDAMAGRALNLAYCDGNPPASCPGEVCEDPCSQCPCNPFVVLTPNFENGDISTFCSAVDMKNFDPVRIRYRESESLCLADGRVVSDGGGSPAYIVRRVATTIDTGVSPNLARLGVTYAMKTQRQFEETGLDVGQSGSYAVMSFEISGHRDDWSAYLPGWNSTWVPHVP